MPEISVYKVVTQPTTPTGIPSYRLHFEQQESVVLTRKDLNPNTPDAAIIAIANTGEYRQEERATGRTSRIALALVLEASKRRGASVEASDHFFSVQGNHSLCSTVKAILSAIGAKARVYHAPSGVRVVFD